MFNLYVDYSRQLSCPYSIFISFNYNPSYVQIIKGLKVRRYDANSKQWEIPYESYNEFISILNTYNIPYNAEAFMKSIEVLQKKVQEKQNLQQQEEKIDISILDNVDFKLSPREYQKEGIAYGLTHNKFLLADQPGLGKSLQCLNIAQLKRGGKKCLIIVGYDSLQFNWVKEVEKCTNEKGYVLGQRVLKSGKNKGDIRKGNMEERMEDLIKINKIEPFFIITSVATLRHNEKIKYTDKNGKEKSYNNFTIADKIEELCKEGVFGRVIFDEAQVVKSITALQTQALLRIKSPLYKILATGTPIMNKHIDLYPMMLWLDKEERNFFSFREHYCVMGGFKNKQIVGNKNGDELNRYLSTFMLRRKKEDVLDLPEKIFIDEYLEMDIKQATLYDKVKKLTKAQMAKMKGNKAVILSMLINLRKITCHPKWYDEKYKDSVKFERVLQLMNEISENNQKAIIFSNWATPIEWLFEELQVYNPAMIIGGTKDRMKQVEKFQEDETCKVILGTGGAMGTGLTLNKASNVILLDQPWNRALEEQWIDRAHRIGTKNAINIYKLICKNTVDEMVYKTVNKKGIVCDNVIDGISLEELMQIFN